MKLMDSIYLIGSLRNEQLVDTGNALREALPGVEIFDDWWAPGRRADDHWKEYEQARGRTYKQALGGWAARHVFEFDKFHLDRVDAGVLILPAGRSCHLEMGYLAGQEKPTYVLMDNPDRWDVMYQFATGITFSMEELVDRIQGEQEPSENPDRGLAIPIRESNEERQPREVGQEVPEASSTGSYLVEGPVHPVRGRSGGDQYPESYRTGVQWVPEGDEGQHGSIQGQGD